MSQCALSLCNIIYDVERPKKFIHLCGSTKSKMFALKICWKFECTIYGNNFIVEKSRKESVVLCVDDIPRISWACSYFVVKKVHAIAKCESDVIDFRILLRLLSRFSFIVLKQNKNE